MCVIGGVRCAVTVLWVLEEDYITPDVTVQITIIIMVVTNTTYIKFAVVQNGIYPVDDVSDLL